MHAGIEHAQVLIYHTIRLFWHLTKLITIGVRVPLVIDRQVLLVRHAYGCGWYLLGGGVKRGETLEQAARHEVAEEVGARLHALRL